MKLHEYRRAYMTMSHTPDSRQVQTVGPETGNAPTSVQRCNCKTQQKQTSFTPVRHAGVGRRRLALVEWYGLSRLNLTINTCTRQSQLHWNVPLFGTAF